MQIQAPALRIYDASSQRELRAVSQRSTSFLWLPGSLRRARACLFETRVEARRPGNTLAPICTRNYAKTTQKSGPGARALNNPHANTALSFWMATRSVKEAIHLSR